MYEHTDQWLLSTLYNANRNDVDTYRLYLTMRRYIHDNRNFIGAIEQITPKEIRFKPATDLADDCFYSVSMFTRYINARSDRRGAPNARYYSRLGRQAFKHIGFPGISKNWKFWVAYVQEHMCI